MIFILNINEYINNMLIYYINMSQDIKFCPNCNNILNITKNPPKKKQTTQLQQLIETPNTVSVDSPNNSSDEYSSDEDNENNQIGESNDGGIIEAILKKLENGEKISDSSFNDLRLEQFTKHKYYTKLDKKSKALIQSKLISYFEKIEDTTNAFYSCVICSYSKPIEPGTLILTKISSGITGTYMNYDKLKNRINNKMLGYTRNYICYNDKCISHKDHTKREAVIYRIGSNIQAWYTCCACQFYWKGE